MKKIKREYKHKTTTPDVKEFQRQLKAANQSHTLSLATVHRDILIDGLLGLVSNLPTPTGIKCPNDILLHTTKASSSLARFVIAMLLREYGYTITTIATVLNRSPATIFQGIERLRTQIIDNPTTPGYTNSYINKYSTITKLELLDLLNQLRKLNEKLHSETKAFIRNTTDSRISQAAKEYTT